MAGRPGEAGESGSARQQKTAAPRPAKRLIGVSPGSAIHHGVFFTLRGHDFALKAQVYEQNVLKKKSLSIIICLTAECPTAVG